MTNIIWVIVFTIIMTCVKRYVINHKPNAPRTGLFKNDRRVENWKDVF